jgi:hypothetical protein
MEMGKMLKSPTMRMLSTLIILSILPSITSPGTQGDQGTQDHQGRRGEYLAIPLGQMLIGMATCFGRFLKTQIRQPADGPTLTGRLIHFKFTLFTHAGVPPIIITTPLTVDRFERQFHLTIIPNIHEFHGFCRGQKDMIDPPIIENYTPKKAMFEYFAYLTLAELPSIFAFPRLFPITHNPNLP